MQHPPRKVSKPQKVGRLSLVVLALAMAIAIGFALYVQNQHPSPPPLPQLPKAARILHQRPSEDILHVTIRPPVGEPYTLIMENNQLCLVREDGLLPIKEPYGSRILQALTHLTIEETVTEDIAEVSLADMGLAPARYEALVRYADGSEETLAFGDSAPHNTHVYVRWSGDSGVSLCDAGMAEVFTLTSGELLPVPSLEVAPSLITDVHIQNANGSVGFALRNGAKGRLVEPYVYPMDQEGLHTLLSTLASFRLGTPQGAVTSQNRALYGFDKPLCTVEITQKAGTVNETDELGSLVSVHRKATSLRLVLGQALGEFFYTCEYDGQCYLVSRFLAEPLVGMAADTLLTTTPAALEGEALVSLLLQAPQNNIAVDIRRQERVLENNELARDENGQLLYDTMVTINGRPTAQAQLDLLEERLSELTVAGSVPEGYSPTGTPRWTLTLRTETDTTRTLESYPMNAFADALCVDGVCLHFVYPDAIDALMTGWCE